jgi:hypothetical protein
MDSRDRFLLLVNWLSLSAKFFWLSFISYFLKLNFKVVLGSQQKREGVTGISHMLCISYMPCFPHYQ